MFYAAPGQRDHVSHKLNTKLNPKLNRVVLLREHRRTHRKSGRAGGRQDRREGGTRREGGKEGRTSSVACELMERETCAMRPIALCGSRIISG
jgi:hypothetical protein